MGNPWEPPWNVGDDTPLAQLVKGGLSSNFNGGGGGMPQISTKTGMAPGQAAAAFVQANPNHPMAQELIAFMQGGIQVSQRVSGPFNASEFQRGAPTKLRREDLPLGSIVALGPGLTARFTATVQKPFVGRKLILAGETTAFVVASIVAQGQTMTAAAGDIPADAYANVDSFDNIAFPAMGSGASVVIEVRNVSGAPASLFASIRGETGEA